MQFLTMTTKEYIAKVGPEQAHKGAPHIFENGIGQQVVLSDDVRSSLFEVGSTWVCAYWVGYNHKEQGFTEPYTPPEASKNYRKLYHRGWNEARRYGGSTAKPELSNSQINFFCVVIEQHGQDATLRDVTNVLELHPIDKIVEWCDDLSVVHDEPSVNDFIASIVDLKKKEGWKATLVSLLPDDVAAVVTAEKAEKAETAEKEHEHRWGPVERARFTGNPHRRCHDCGFITLDLFDDDEDEETED